MIVQNSYKLARSRKHVLGMSCGSRTHIAKLVQVSINSYRIPRVYLYFVMNIVDMSYGTRRTVLTKKLMTQLMDICGDMWRVITRAYSSHIVGKLVTVGQGLKDWRIIKAVEVFLTVYAPNFEKVGSILLSACPSVRLIVRPLKKKIQARVLKFHIWIPLQKIAYSYFFLV